jgi:hypothetical protein
MPECNILKDFHPMIGIDLHNVGPPPALTVGIVPLPHIAYCPAICQGIWGLFGCGQKKIDVEHSDGTIVLGGSDAGSFIPHICVPHTLLPVIILTSASKSYFFAPRDEAGNKGVAVAVKGTYNFNLNCSGFIMPPMPTGIVNATMATRTAHVTDAEIGAALMCMLRDAFVQFVLNLIFSRFPVPDVGEKYILTLLLNIPLMLLADLVGSPLGFSFDLQDEKGKKFPSISRWAGNKYTEAIQPYIDSPPPGAGATPTPATQTPATTPAPTTPAPTTP